MVGSARKMTGRALPTTGSEQPMIGSTLPMAGRKLLMIGKTLPVIGRAEVKPFQTKIISFLSPEHF